jgi:hypothetical protein
VVGRFVPIKYQGVAMQITATEVAIGAMLVTLGGIMYTERRSAQLEYFRIKHQSYSDLLTASEELYEASLMGDPVSERFLKAAYQMNGALAGVDLLAPKSLHNFARDVETKALLPRRSEERDSYFDNLQNRMRLDLKRHQKKLFKTD